MDFQPVSEYYINGKKVDPQTYYRVRSGVDGIHEHIMGKACYSYVFYKDQYWGSVEDMEEKRLLFVVKVGMSFEQWRKKNGYKTRGGK
jgi:hypothetical protein